MAVADRALVSIGQLRGVRCVVDHRQRFGLGKPAPLKSDGGDVLTPPGSASIQATLEGLACT
ncbi:hypothetical protein D3C80_1991310 [compost metagenome]